MSNPATATAPMTVPGELPRFFAENCLNFSPDARAHVQKLVEVAWLLMAEGHPIIEDMDGALERPDLMEALKLVFAEFLADLDLRLLGTGNIDASHSLPLALERGTVGLGLISGGDFASLLHLAEDEPPQATHEAMSALWAKILADFPIALVDPLQPENQGAVLVNLRKWTKLCTECDVSSEFLVEMMKAV